MIADLGKIRGAFSEPMEHNYPGTLLSLPSEAKKVFMGLIHRRIEKGTIHFNEISGSKEIDDIWVRYHEEVMDNNIVDAPFFFFSYW